MDGNAYFWMNLIIAEPLFESDIFEYLELYQDSRVYLDEYPIQEILRKEYFNKQGGDVLKELMGES